MSLKFSPSTQNKFDNQPLMAGLPDICKQTKIAAVFDSLYGPHQEMFVNHIMKITWGEEWAIQVCEERLAASQDVATLLASKREIYQAANDENYSQTAYAG